MSSTVFVMGATSAIAQSLIHLELQAGNKVVAAGRNMEKLQELYGSKGDVCLIQVEATDPESVKVGFAEADNAGFHVDAYAHCVGSILVAPLHRTSDAQFQDVLNVNLLSAVYGLRAFVNGCRERKSAGSAVLVSTCATGIGVANHEAIAAAKAGIEGLAKSAANTYAPDGIRINVVAPGLTDSPIASAFLKSEVMRAASAKQYPLQGVNTPEDVAQAMHWLLSDQASRTTGTILNVDGGFRNTRPLVK